MRRTLIADLLAGLSVSFAALSLGAAFGVMSGRGAFAGMIGAAVIPIITSLLGGTRLQASGPTAPMTAVTAMVVAMAYERFPGDARLAGEFVTLILVMSSVLLLMASAFRLGRFIKLVPQVVVLGFMNGIAVLIWTEQIQRLTGIGGKTPIEGGVLLNSAIAVAVLAVILLFPIILHRLRVPAAQGRFMPAIFITIVVFTVLTTAFELPIEHVSIGSGAGSLREYLAMLHDMLPRDERLLSPELLLAALPFALKLSLLAYLDSLLTSLVIDRMTGESTRHDKELMAQGIANGASALLQGIPGAQATIRSVLLLKEGARTRLAGVMVGVYALLGFLVFNKAIVLIASAVFVGVLLKAGWDVLDRDFPILYFRQGWFRIRARNLQLLFILYSTVVTVVVDLNVAVITGSLLFHALKRPLQLPDAEAFLAEVRSDTLLGQELE